MKCNSLVSGHSLSNEEKKSTFTIYTNTDLTQEKMTSSEEEVAMLRGELEVIQKALKHQTRRCRQLVAEYTKRLQIKEQSYQAEKRLRDDQLANVLRALLIFEARLRQEQKLLSHRLREKDEIIKKQQIEMQNILTSRYCKKCNSCYNVNSNLQNYDSSSEYVVTDYHDYQSSNFESLDSSSETYASVSEKDFEPKKFIYSNPSISSEDNISVDSKKIRHLFTKNKFKDSLSRRGKKMVHRKSIDNYFDIVNRTNDNHSPSSNDENTSNDYENLDSLTSENVKHDLICNKSEIIEEDDSKCDDQSFISDINTTVILNKNSKNHQDDESDKVSSPETKLENLEEEPECKERKISDAIPIFQDEETNDNWYASASDNEDENHRDIYRNNPVLECMNQILLRNINDPLSSPPKSPNVEKRFNTKRVQFDDEEDPQNSNKLNSNQVEGNYYETPIQKPPNFYETPQSIYSNDYEQILSQCSETFNENSEEVDLKAKNNSRNKEEEESNSHYYIDMDTKDEQENQIIRKSKILRPPPALPPKPANLLSKYKVQNFVQDDAKDKVSEKDGSEPDYCSISEINLPTVENDVTKTTAIIENNSISKERFQKRLSLPPENGILTKIENDLSKSPPQYKPISLKDPIPNMVMKKSVEKVKTQFATQTSIKTDTPRKSLSPEIPKLPQVKEIIIPEETEAEPKENVTHDNYVKNNTQILKQHTDRTKPIQMGSSVSSLIKSFNNKQILSEIKQKNKERNQLNKRLFASFENLPDIESQKTLDETESKLNKSYDAFDLSQNFEEFKLDDCDISDYTETSSDTESKSYSGNVNTNEGNNKFNVSYGSSTHVEVVRATNNFSTPHHRANSLQQFKKKIELEKSRAYIKNELLRNDYVNKLTYNEPTYEHFLECTGLSSKSILTPSRLLSNHKNMLKPKDVKLRSKIKANNVFEKQENNVKYWSEPYL